MLCHRHFHLPNYSLEVDEYYIVICLQNIMSISYYLLVKCPLVMSREKVKAAFFLKT